MLTAGTGKRYELQIVIGGTGGASGSGGSTTVTHTGDIFTHGRHSDGLLAQSIGGGGGNADWNIAAGLNPNTSGINLAVGGAPGDGGSGGSVMVNHTGYIGTAYDDSSAIFAQSVGGGGGDASFDMASSLLSSNTLDLGLGRTGGTGGTGGNVHVSSDGTLMTAGIRSVGLLAQSVGNGGGRSGAISVGVSSSSGKGTAEKSVGANIAIGLEGGDGGIGGAVDVHAKGTIKTEGAKSHALHAQSVGGGGGIGGAATNIIFRETASVKVGVGGTGGTGSFGGKVTVTSSATVRTEGAESHGILAQSIGGGGGTGGYAGLVGIQTGGAAANGNSGLGVSVGGSGGTGGAGGQVVVENMGAITTTGADSLGVFAESIGGGGGDGGLVINGTVAGKGRGTNLTVGIGGAGGNGGVGGAVDVTNGGNGVITTSGIGIFAQSIGGGGGNAGLVANIEISKPAADASSTSLTINIGGAGGTGGTGGNVDVENLAGGQIRTSGSKAYGVFAQSIGGGGGNGSSVVSANFSSGSKNTTLIGLNIGGSGGDGGHGGVVTVTNEGTIETSGDDAHGVFAQSIAGGGGNGGLSLATNGVLRRGGGKATPLVTVGGAGGNGEDAGNVTVTGTGKIVTSGANAHGIVAQSIGGGGGNAGVGIGLTSDVKSTAFANTLSFAVGGVRDLLLGGASGGKGGKVKVDYAGDIEINGAGSEAIKAESINGGGGGLVLDFDGITSLPGGAALPGIPGVGGPEDATDPALTIRAGGEGQMNTDAGAVTVSHTGNVMKGGNTNSVAVSQMSIGGGGGTVYAKVNLATPLAATTTGQLALDVVLGGANGTNNSGNVIDSSHVGDIVTTGSHTRGVALQSIGGGGGRGIVSVTGAVETLGAVTLALGGTNGTTEMGGAVSYSRTGALTTSGDGSDGVLLQSIGGGGGSLDLRVGGGALATAVALAGAAGPTSAALLTGAVTLGAAGGSALHGGGVSATLTGDVTTVGAGALGVVVQSIGAGGGAARMTGSPGLTVMLGGSAGATGDGGTIAIEHTGAVTTSGDHAHGLFAQSIGGGGAVFSPGGPVTVSAANAGDGGDLTLVQTGHITTTGAGAFGVFAQSLGGGGGYVAGLGALSAGGLGSGGAISLTLEGSVKALAESSTAVYLHSAGVAGSGDIGVVLKAGSSLVGGALGTAVSFDGGADNRLTNHGVVTSTAGVAGWTVARYLGQRDSRQLRAAGGLDRSRWGHQRGDQHGDRVG